MFASKSPRDLNDDPKPFVDREDGPGKEIRQAWPDPWTEYDPRPEFDHVQHNEPNRLLIAARRAHADRYLDAFMEGFLSDRNTNHPEIDHAQKVLQRLRSVDWAAWRTPNGGDDA